MQIIVEEKEKSNHKVLVIRFLSFLPTNTDSCRNTYKSVQNFQEYCPIYAAGSERFFFWENYNCIVKMDQCNSLIVIFYKGWGGE